MNRKFEFDLDLLTWPHISRHVCFIEGEGDGDAGTGDGTDGDDTASDGAGDAGTGGEGAGDEGKTPEEIEAARLAAEEEAKKKTPAKPVAAKPDWKDDRLAKKTAQVQALKDEIAALKAAKPGEQTPGLTQEQLDALVDQKAEEKRLQAQFDDGCNDAVKIGREKYPDFDARLNAVKAVVDNDDAESVKSYFVLVAAALELGEAAKILHSLGEDPNEAARIMAMPPVKMTVALTKLASKSEEPPPDNEITKLGKPITPVGGKSATHDAEIKPSDPGRADNLSTATWMARREAEIAAKATKH